MSAKQSGAGGAKGSTDRTSGGVTRPLMGIAAGAAVGSAAIAAALIYAGRLRNPLVDATFPRSPRPSPRVASAPRAPAAFASEVGAPGAIVQIRDAGPDTVRDPERDREWDRADEMSDESFPASDPPSTY